MTLFHVRPNMPWWWRHKLQNDCILSEWAGFESQDSIRGIFQLRIVVNLLSQCVKHFLNNVSLNNAYIHFLLLSCFLSSITIVRFFNCNLTTFQEKGKIRKQARKSTLKDGWQNSSYSYNEVGKHWTRRVIGFWVLLWSSGCCQHGFKSWHCSKKSGKCWILTFHWL